jgi:hypothetical protein
MRRRALLAVLGSIAVAGCSVYLWADDHRDWAVTPPGWDPGVIPPQVKVYAAPSGRRWAVLTEQLYAGVFGSTGDAYWIDLKGDDLPTRGVQVFQSWEEAQPVEIAWRGDNAVMISVSDVPHRARHAAGPVKVVYRALDAWSPLSPDFRSIVRDRDGACHDRDSAQCEFETKRLDDRIRTRTRFLEWARKNAESITVETPAASSSGMPSV